MANYNPHVPQILGQEWVPIRDEDLTLDPFANSLERGYSFSLSNSTQVSNARFYMNTFPPLFVRNQAYTANIYPRGTENDSGPVRKVIIPCNLAGVTGSGIFISPSGTPPEQAVYNPSANSYIRYTIGNSVENMSQFWFATNNYAQLLSGKRILGLNFLTNIDVSVAATANPANWAPTYAGWLIPWLANDGTIATGSFSAGFVQYQALVTFQTPVLTRTFLRVKMGDADIAYGATNVGTTSAQDQVSQWTYSELQRFEASAPNRLSVALTSTPFNDVGATVLVSYMALEVFYCEERRVAFGTNNVMGLFAGRPNRSPFTLGMNQINLRNTSGQTNPILPAGDYTVTLSLANTGDDFNVAYSPFATGKVNELRQFYELPTVPGVQVNLPFPLNDDAIGTTITRESTALLPQLSLHTSGGTVITDCHPYGRQAAGQVWGSNFVSQDVDDSVISSLRSWQWVRWYSRRFGDTTAPLVLSSSSPNASGSGMRVQITPAEHDALPEVLDGWKEVTLRFPTSPLMGANTQPNWRWTSTSEAAGSRWEVLGASAYAASGIAQQMTPNIQFGQVPAGQQLYAATYGAPSLGATVNEDWLPQLGPFVSGSTVDQTADAVLIFSQDMPTVTGLGVSVLSQALTGIGQNCGLNPCGIPTHILYPRLIWGAYGNSAVASDTFARSATGWGVADTGQTYTDIGGTVEGDYVTTGSYGTHLLTSANVNRLSVLTSTFATNIHSRVKLMVDQNPLGATFRSGILFNYQDSSNYDLVDIRWNTNGTVEVAISKIVAAALTTVVSVTAGAFNAGQWWYLDVDCTVAGTIRAKAWPVGQTEPTLYQASTAANFVNGAVGLRSLRSSGNTNTGATAYFDNWSLTGSTWNFGYLELQRQDSVTDWATIMKATNPGVIQFNDYEARTNTTSNYRIRGVDVYGFTGPWSSTVSIFVTSPGVSGTCLFNYNHITIFTSNERQNGSANLAYSDAWESDVAEDFANPEAGFTQLQPMFEKNFYTAFKPMERGGDQFSRNILVQAAAISAPTLPGFQSLYDMAWNSVSYVCVRDEDGNRWFANINVPSGVVKNRRRLYLANIQVIEVTDTPSQVNP